MDLSVANVELSPSSASTPSKSAAFITLRHDQSITRIGWPIEPGDTLELPQVGIPQPLHHQGTTGIGGTIKPRDTLELLQVDIPQPFRVPTVELTEAEGYRTVHPAQWQLRPLVENHPVLTGRTKQLVNRFWIIVLSKALQSGISATGAIDVEKDSEDGSSQAVLRVYLEQSATQALAFWDGLEVDLDRWMSHLDKRSRDTLTRNIGLRIHWNVG